MKYTMWLVVALLFVVGVGIGLRLGLGGPEDAWLCDDGVWVAHGHPSAQMPSQPCGTVQPPAARERTISIFAYDAKRDSDASGNIMCSEKGVVPVSRTIALTTTPIQDAVRTLLSSGLTEAERAGGLSSDFPLTGLALTGATLKDGVLTLSFIDPQLKTGGGSCRVGILRRQIEATARQFDGVRHVRIIPEELFQP